MFRRYMYDFTVVMLLSLKYALLMLGFNIKLVFQNKNYYIMFLLKIPIQQSHNKCVEDGFFLAEEIIKYIFQGFFFWVFCDF